MNNLLLLLGSATLVLDGGGQEHSFNGMRMCTAKQPPLPGPWTKLCLSSHPAAVS
jgi:hypothetical protein